MLTKTTLQTAVMLADTAMDVNLKKKYGTSVNEYMTREHAKEVRNQINVLRGEFEKFGKSKNSSLSLDELYEFLQKINVINNFNDFNIYLQPTERQITQEDVFKILQLLNKNQNEEIIVDDFVQSYLLIEEKIKINNTKYEKAQDELTEEISRNKESLLKMDDELELNDGLTNKSKLYITVIEARDLLSDNIISDCNPSVTLTFQEDIQETKTKNNTSNPTWYENFVFKINSPSGALKLEAFDNALMGKKSIGLLSIDLTDLMDQKKRMQWYDLYNTNHINCGKIYLKIQCIINFRHYYEGEIETAEKEMAIIQNAFDLTNYYVECMSSPFGLLFIENLDDLINNQQFQQVDELIKVLEKNKESIYHKREINYSEGYSGLSGAEKNKKITLSTLTKVLMYCLIIFSFISLLERSDFINLVISILTLNYFIIDNTGMIIKYLRYFTWLLGGAVIMDLVWFILNFWAFFIGEKNSPERGLKRIVYLISICGTVIKCLFIYALRNLKRKKVFGDFQTEDMNYN